MGYQMQTTPAPIIHPVSLLKKWETPIARMVILVPLVGSLVAISSLLVRSFTWIDGLVLAITYLFTSVGVTFGYHRLLTHDSFQTTRWIKNLATIAAAMSLQGPAIWWVAHHRKHHQFSDQKNDVHSPVTDEKGILAKWKAFWHGHLGWMWNSEKVSAKKFAGALLQDKDVVLIDTLYPLWAILSLALPVALAGAIYAGAQWWMGNEILATPFRNALLGGFLWGGLFRIFALHHATWAVNSVCHVFGARPWKSTDQSRNNVFVALLTAGEGWHNGHHAFPTSARHGLRFWEIDLTWILIKGLSLVGLASHIKLPSPEELVKKRNL